MIQRTELLVLLHWHEVCDSVVLSALGLLRLFHERMGVLTVSMQFQVKRFDRERVLAILVQLSFAMAVPQMTLFSVSVTARLPL